MRANRQFQIAVMVATVLFFVLSQASAEDPPEQERLYTEGGCVELMESTARVPQTGQVLCYEYNEVEEKWVAIDCPEPGTTGQDGELLKGVEWSAADRFTVNLNADGTPDGTVKDNLTGLVWLQVANCIATQYPEFDTDGSVGDGAVTWQNALNFVANINDGTYPDCGAGYFNWRLPNVRELQSLVDYGESKPALPAGHPFSEVQSSYYWSSTTSALYPDSAWGVAMRYGGVYNVTKDSHTQVWPVRSDND